MHWFDMKKVLVIEDELLTLKLIEFLLTKAGHQVFVTPNGSEAKAYLHLNYPDLILTDMMIPGATGHEIVVFVRQELKRNTPILLLSASEVDEMVNNTLQAGANHFMSKPFSPGELQHCVANLLAKSASVQLPQIH
jgi:two-component system, OmpR family, response regulator VicR